MKKLQRIKKNKERKDEKMIRRKIYSTKQRKEKKKQ